MIFLLLTYYVAGFEDSGEIFFKTYLIVALNLQCGSSMGIILATLAGDAATASTINLLFFMPFVQFSGVMVNIDTIPSWISWYGYLDPLRYSLDAMTDILFPYEYTQPIDVPESYGYRIGYANCAWAMFGMVVALRTISYFVLYS